MDPRRRRPITSIFSVWVNGDTITAGADNPRRMP